MNGQERINEMYAFVVVDDDGTEGIPAFRSGDRDLPLVGADTARVEALRPIAENMARELSKPVELVRFTVREHLETIE